MLKEIKYGRRQFLSSAAITIAAAELSMLGFANAPSNKTNLNSTMINTGKIERTFDTLKQVDAGVLSVGYAEAGKADAPPVILLH